MSQLSFNSVVHASYAQETESTIRNEDTRDDLPFAHTFLAPPADPIGGGEPNKGKVHLPPSKEKPLFKKLFK